MTMLSKAGRTTNRVPGGTRDAGTVRAGALAALTLLGLFAPAASGQTLLWRDNLNTADTANFDGAPLAGRLSGTLAGNTYLRSYGTQQAISNNALLIVGGSNRGVRWEDATNDPTTGATDRFDWAAAAGGSILAAGGLVVAYDWSPGSNADSNWYSFNVGVANADTAVNTASTDYGILVRNLSNGTDTIQRFDNGVLVGQSNAFAPVVNTTYAVSHTLSFGSFADGSPVNIVTRINGTAVATDTFTWDGNSGAFRMDLGSNGTGRQIDNLTVSSVPEPTSLVPLAVGSLALLGRRRRALTDRRSANQRSPGLGKARPIYSPPNCFIRSSRSASPGGNHG